MNEWKTDVPPIGVKGVVFVTCGNGEVVLMEASDLREDFRGLCWIAWQTI